MSEPSRWLSRCDEGSYNYIIPEDYREREPNCNGLRYAQGSAWSVGR